MSVQCLVNVIICPLCIICFSYCDNIMNLNINHVLVKAFVMCTKERALGTGALSLDLKYSVYCHHDSASMNSVRLSMPSLLISAATSICCFT